MRHLAYEAGCRACGSPIYLAICSDGRWRAFDRDEFPPAPLGVWAWRRHAGMQEQDTTSGKVLHRCAAYFEQAHDLAPGLDLVDHEPPEG